MLNEVLSVPEAGAIASPEFTDDVFRIQDDNDTTKELAFQLSGLSVGTTRTVTVPNGNCMLPTTFADGASLYIGNKIADPDPNITGGSNIVIGYNAVRDQVAVGSSVIIGTYAGLRMTSCADNTAIGAFSMSGYGGVTAVTGDENVGVGSFSLKSITDGSGNTCLGFNAGLNTTTGSNNIMIGRNANCLATGSDQIVIGASISATASNQFVVPIASIVEYANDAAADAVVPVGGIYRVVADPRVLKIRIV